MLRKDHVFLFERFFYFLEERNEFGAIVMDESEKKQESKFIKRMERYFTRTQKGIERCESILPYPFYVKSDLSIPTQVADVIVYAVNWGFRLPHGHMDSNKRDEVHQIVNPMLRSLQFQCEREFDGQIRRVYGIVPVPDPYTSRE